MTGATDEVVSLRRRLDDAVLLLRLAEEEDDADTVTEVRAEVAALGKAIEEWQIHTLLSGAHDSREAVVTIRAREDAHSATFADRLLRMYLRWADHHSYPTDVYDTCDDESGLGLRWATFAVKAPYAYGMLSAESGVHQLVDTRSFDTHRQPSDKRRQRQISLATVEVMPLAEETRHGIADNDTRVEVYRSSGPPYVYPEAGVRLTHIPTGIVVRCNDSRPEWSARAVALMLLQTRLEHRHRHEQAASGPGATVRDGFGDDPVRSYRLAADRSQVVHDLRTGQRASDVNKVFWNGDIDAFITAGVRWRSQRQHPTGAV